MSLIGIIVATGMLVFGVTMLALQVDSGYDNESWIDKAIIYITLLIATLLLVFFSYHMHAITM